MNDLTADNIKNLFFSAIHAWHDKEERVRSWPDVEGLISFPDQAHESDFLKLAFYLQLINCYQWHEEDKSHQEGLPDQMLAGIKKRIDRSNQRRNDFIEFFDRKVLDWYEALPDRARDDAPLHSETPGHILDRLTIIALKIDHLSVCVAGGQAGAAGDAIKISKLHVLEEQWRDLAGCFEMLIDDFKNGRKRMKVYTQYKIYDPSPPAHTAAQREKEHHKPSQ